MEENPDESGPGEAADAGTPPEQQGVRIEALLPKRTYDELEAWGQEIGCGAGFVLWAVVADAVHKRPDDVRPRVAAAWEEAKDHGMEPSDMGPEEG